MAKQRESLKDLFVAELFSVVVGLGLYLFLLQYVREKEAILFTCATLFLLSFLSWKKSYATLALSSFVAVFVIFSSGISETYLGSGGVRPVVFSAGLTYLSLLAFPMGMMAIGLKFRWSALSLFLEGMAVWAGISYLPNMMSF